MHHHLAASHAAAISDAHAVAAINGTILAIAIAAFSAYLVFVFQSMDPMETDVIEKVHEARGEILNITIRDEGVFDAKGLGLGALVEAFRCVVWGQPEFEGMVLPEKPNLLGRGRALQVIMSAIAELPVLRPPDPPIAIHEVSDWVEGAGNRLGELAFILETQGAEIAKLVAATDAAWLTESFGPWVAKYIQRLRDVRVALAGMQRYGSRRQPGRGQVLGALWLVLFTFVVGVAVPVVAPMAPSVLYAWIPAIVYVLALLGGVVLVSRRYHPQTSA